MTLNEHLISLHACAAARYWADGKTATEAWRQCQRPDWLLWWASRTSSTKVDIVRVAVAVAEDTLPLCSAVAKPVTGAAIQAARNWADNPTQENRKLARDAADAAAAYAADAAAYAAAAAADAADAAAYAAADAAAYAAVKTQKKQQYCDLIRSMLKQPWIEPPDESV